MAEKENKKRKRQSNGVETPNTRAATEGVAKIKVTFENDTGLHPVLVSAPGITAPNIPFKAYSKALSARQASKAPTKPNTHDILLHSSQHPRLDYTASPIALDRNLSHYIAVYDPATQQLQITPAHHLSLRSTLRSETQDDEPENRQRTIRQQREELGREFGTKRAKKAIADKTVNAIDKGGNDKRKTDDVQNAILESMSQNTPAQPASQEDDLEAQLASKPIPKPNLAAETPEDVYSFDTLIPPADARLVQVKEWQDKARAQEDVEFQHRFPAFRLAPIGKGEDILKLKALKYLTLLLEFHDALLNAGRSGGKKVPKKDVLARKLAAWPENLVSSVTRRFSNESFELPKFQLEYLYTHICALSLYIDAWTTDMTNLKDDLKMENKQLMQYFRELGCKVAAPTEKERESRGMKKAVAAATRVARLRVPLDFPRARVGRRR